jgi:hypothetical protein
MLQNMVIKLAPLKHALPYFGLIPLRSHRMLRDGIPMPILDGLRRLEVGMFRVVDFLG